MHEKSLVASLLRQVEQIRLTSGGARIEQVQIEVGPLAGVDPVLMQIGFNEEAAPQGMAGAALVIHEVPLTAACPACGIVAVEAARILCPYCGASDVQLRSGDEVRLCSVTVVCMDSREALA